MRIGEQDWQEGVAKSTAYALPLFLIALTYSLAAHRARSWSPPLRRFVRRSPMSSASSKTRRSKIQSSSSRAGICWKRPSLPTSTTWKCRSKRSRPTGFHSRPASATNSSNSSRAFFPTAMPKKSKGIQDNKSAISRNGPRGTMRRCNQAAVEQSRNLDGLPATRERWDVARLRPRRGRGQPGEELPQSIREDHPLIVLPGVSPPTARTHCRRGQEKEGRTHEQCGLIQTSVA